jgi:hypothetical protein
MTTGPSFGMFDAAESRLPIFAVKPEDSPSAWKREPQCRAPTVRWRGGRDLLRKALARAGVAAVEDIHALLARVLGGSRARRKPVACLVSLE